MVAQKGIFSGADDGGRSVVVKLKGERELLLKIKNHLENEFITIPTSRLRRNDADAGVHIYLLVLGGRRR